MSTKMDDDDNSMDFFIEKFRELYENMRKTDNTLKIRYNLRNLDDFNEIDEIDDMEEMKEMYALDDDIFMLNEDEAKTDISDESEFKIETRTKLTAMMNCIELDRTSEESYNIDKLDVSSDDLVKKLSPICQKKKNKKRLKKKNANNTNVKSETESKVKPIEMDKFKLARKKNARKNKAKSIEEKSTLAEKTKSTNENTKSIEEKSKLAEKTNSTNVKTKSIKESKEMDKFALARKKNARKNKAKSIEEKLILAEKTNSTKVKSDTESKVKVTEMDKFALARKKNARKNKTKSIEEKSTCVEKKNSANEKTKLIKMVFHPDTKKIVKIKSGVIGKTKLNENIKSDNIETTELSEKETTELNEKETTELDENSKKIINREDFREIKYCLRNAIKKLKSDLKQLKVANYNMPILGDLKLLSMGLLSNPTNEIVFDQWLELLTLKRPEQIRPETSNAEHTNAKNRKKRELLKFVKLYEPKMKKKCK